MNEYSFIFMVLLYYITTSYVLNSLLKEAEKINLRALSKERRREQLIEATIQCLSKKGLSSTTLADVAKEAGLSQGIVNLHFNSKDNLLADTLRFLTDEYDERFMKTFYGAPADPADQLLALMEMDLKPPICDRSKIAVWFAFFGETKAQPTYRKICASRDQKYAEILKSLVEKIVTDGKYIGINPGVISTTLSSLTDGMWLSCLISPKSFNRTESLLAIQSYLSSTFPNHYPR
tara:strand:- start:1653 stop:2354 length:702 start_codon:yes stop_codon:yes gene_type:complete